LSFVVLIAVSLRHLFALPLIESAFFVLLIFSVSVVSLNRRTRRSTPIAHSALCRAPRPLRWPPPLRYRPRGNRCLHPPAMHHTQAAHQPICAGAALVPRRTCLRFWPRTVCRPRCQCLHCRTSIRSTNHTRWAMPEVAATFAHLKVAATRLDSRRFRCHRL
jgi:hypothetical protein